MGSSELNVQLWDIAGQERFAGLSRIFYTHAVAAIIVYDVTSRETFDSVIKWKQDIDAKGQLPHLVTLMLEVWARFGPVEIAFASRISLSRSHFVFLRPSLPPLGRQDPCTPIGQQG
jgi:hypothetical protein